MSEKSATIIEILPLFFWPLQRIGLFWWYQKVTLKAESLLQSKVYDHSGNIKLYFLKQNETVTFMIHKQLKGYAPFKIGEKIDFDKLVNYYPNKFKHRHLANDE